MQVRYLDECRCARTGRRGRFQRWAMFFGHRLAVLRERGSSRVHRVREADLVVELPPYVVRRKRAAARAVATGGAA